MCFHLLKISGYNKQTSKKFEISRLESSHWHLWCKFIWITSTFYTENTMRKLVCKHKDQVATKDKNNIVYEIDWSNCEAVYFGEFKRSLKSRWDEHKRSVRNSDCDKNEIAKHCWKADHNFSWDQKKVVDGQSRLILRKIKETIHSSKNPNHINKISYMLPEIWLPNWRQFLVAYLCHIRRF